MLRSIKADEIAALDASEVASSDFVAFAQRLGLTRQPQTVQNYLFHLSSVCSVALTGFNVAVERHAMTDAMEAGKKLGLVSKSIQRERRPSMDELDRLMAHFEDRSKRRKNALPMHRVLAFAIFSTRRQDEIVRILRADHEPGRVLVRDMKNPGEKIGNNVWCGLVPEAEAIIAAMPKGDPRLFPYSTDAAAAAFTRACKLLGITGLVFRDLRHEGVSRLFEMGWTIPRVAEVSGHGSWQSLKRYTHVRQTGDKFKEWKWLPVVTTSKG